ncbi:hypothetical protein BJ138DRAFT_1013419 [Hygrophoropsis aurantiaca]|uniref:Uncharacterized protein n=1 Tax=Hygrophoropsis aurantiaca TaxID=72124 RepID=A0ACB8A4Z2_9AGAM|nr:hypothetical protein BJ138DRAFT_1013419 [Hygrophoropsis aurantiaca]
MAVYRYHQPTAFDVSPTTHAGGAGEDPFRDSPVTPTRRNLRPDIDPADYTPSKRMRLMTAALASTASGSFLVSKTPVTSLSKIPAPVLEGPPDMPNPDWSLLHTPRRPSQMSRNDLEIHASELHNSLSRAKKHIQGRDAIIEGTHAQLVVQNIFTMKQSQALHGKENRKETDRTKLFPEGKGRHLTSEGFMNEVDRSESARKEKLAAKEQRKSGRAEKKSEKAAIETEWKRLLDEHTLAVDAWENECQKQTDAGVLKKNQPSKPKRPLKPKSVPMAQPTASSSSVTLEDLADDEETTDTSDEE